MFLESYREALYVAIEGDQNFGREWENNVLVDDRKSVSITLHMVTENGFRSPSQLTWLLDGDLKFSITDDWIWKKKTCNIFWESFHLTLQVATIGTKWVHGSNLICEQNESKTTVMRQLSSHD
jgi:hypothetical protein